MILMQKIKLVKEQIKAINQFLTKMFVEQD